MNVIKQIKKIEPESLAKFFLNNRSISDRLGIYELVVFKPNPKEEIVAFFGKKIDGVWVEVPDADIPEVISDELIRIISKRITDA